MVDSKWDDSNGLEFYKNTIRLTLHELEKQQRKNLLRLRRAGFSQNSSTPDCGHHGDNSFQEDHFSGIPTTLCINIAIFCIIILVFSILRKRAWNYGRLGFENDEMLDASETVSTDEDAYLLELERGDSGNIFSWIRVIFQLSDREYSRKCGKSAVDYLTFQRHLMYISGCMTVISLLGPLPANTMGKLLVETNAYFAKTTIGNLSVDNILIWIHVVSGVLMYAIAYFFMWRYSRKNLMLEPDRVRNTLMVRGLPIYVEKSDSSGRSLLRSLWYSTN